MKLRNVIRGINKEYALENIHIIDMNKEKVYYSGEYEKYKNCDSTMILYKKEIEEKEVSGKIIQNHRNAFIFVN